MNLTHALSASSFLHQFHRASRLPPHRSLRPQTKAVGIDTCCAWTCLRGAALRGNYTW